jgi:hypothetical protein
MKRAEMAGRYKEAMGELRSALDRAAAPAMAMRFYAGQLAGGAADLDAPALTALPTPSAVLSMLQRIDQARLRLESLWFDLSEEDKEGLPSPEQLAEALAEDAGGRTC